MYILLHNNSNAIRRCLIRRSYTVWLYGVANSYMMQRIYFNKDRSSTFHVIIINHTTLQSMRMKFYMALTSWLNFLLSQNFQLNVNISTVQMSVERYPKFIHKLCQSSRRLVIDIQFNSKNQYLVNCTNCTILRKKQNFFTTFIGFQKPVR